MLDYELGHFAAVSDLFKQHERRDPVDVIPDVLPDSIPFESQREFVREVLAAEVDLRANGTEIVALEEEGESSLNYRAYKNSQGSPSEIVAQGYAWRPGAELVLKIANG
jgi:hypothetical protein